MKIRTETHTHKKNNNKDVKNTYEFCKKLSGEDTFEKQIIKKIIKNEPYEHKKIETPYVSPTVQHAQTTENETKNETDDFLQTASELNKSRCSCNQTKKVDFYDKLFDDVKDIPDSRQIIDDAPATEDIFIDDELFSDTDTKDTKNLVDVITLETDVNDVSLDHVPIDTTPNVPPPPDPLLNFPDILLAKNKGKNTIAKKISKKHKKNRQKKDKIKELTRKAIDNMKKSKHLQVDDMETISYNSNIQPDDSSTINYNSDVEIDDVSDAETID